MPVDVGVFPHGPYFASVLDTPLRDVVGRDVDLDADGLTGDQEFLRFTNDTCADTDGDGIIDSQDTCPRCSASDHQGMVLGELVSGLFGLKKHPFVPDNDQVVYVKAWMNSFDVKSDTINFVPIGDSEFQYLLLYYRYEIIEHAKILNSESIISIPGLLYVFRCDYCCGLRCGWVRVAYIVDVPFWGPVYLGSEEILRE